MGYLPHKKASDYVKRPKSIEPKRIRIKADREHYDLAKWRKLSALYRKTYPFCQAEGCGKFSDHTDHINPIRPLHPDRPGGSIFDWDNLQALCISCHGRKTARERRERKKNFSL